MIPINLVVEDDLSEIIVCQLLQQSTRPFYIGARYGKQGFGYIKRNIAGFNNAAKGTAYFVLTDLDNAKCPSLLIDSWLGTKRHPNLIFRIAVREVESWVMAHRSAFAKFFEIENHRIPERLDEISNAKEFLINLVRNSRNAKIRESVVPSSGSSAKVGPDYGGVLMEFVTKRWKSKQAARHSESLVRALRAIQKFKPVFEKKR